MLPRLRVILSLDQLHDQSLPQGSIEGIQFRCFLQRGNCLVAATLLEQSLGEIGVQNRRRRTAIYSALQMRNSLRIVASLKLAVSERSLNEGIVCIATLQFLQYRRIGGEVLGMLLY